MKFIKFIGIWGGVLFAIISAFGFLSMLYHALNGDLDALIGIGIIAIVCSGIYSLVTVYGPKES